MRDTVLIKKAGGNLNEFWKEFANFKKDDEHDTGGIGRENEYQPTNHFKVGAWCNIAEIFK